LTQQVGEPTCRHFPTSPAIHWAIGHCTGCALLICFVIATFFITAMLLLVVGLLCFLREIALATGSIHVMPR